MPEDAAASDNVIEVLETSLAIKKVVATLPSELQEIILLRFSSELSVKEISEITGLSRFALRRKINNALVKLKLLLQEEDFV